MNLVVPVPKVCVFSKATFNEAARRSRYESALIFSPFYFPSSL